VRSPVVELLAALGRGLSAVGVRWYLFGAQAVLLYGGARLTADVDVTVEAADRSPRTLVSALQREGFELRVADVEDFVERTRVLPLAHSPTGMPLDLVLAGPGPEALFLSRARVHELEGVLVPVAAPEDVVVMKILAGRPKDLEDAAAILSAQDVTVDEDVARDTLRMLEQALDQSDLVPVFEGLLQRRR
jgi:hypothetical protein